MYEISFLISLVSIGLWFHKNSSDMGPLMKLLFFGGIILYALSIFGEKGALDYKLLIAMRDMFALGAASLIFSIFKDKTALFWGSMIGVLLTWGLFYNNIMSTTFPQKTMETESVETINPNVPLASDAELLIEIKEGHGMHELNAISQKYDLTFDRAFFPEKESITDLDDYYLINVPEEKVADLAAIQKELRATGLVDWTEENEVIQVSPQAISTFKTTTKKGYTNDPDVGNQWGLDKMKTGRLYDRLISASNIKPKKRALIAILDTGVAGGHEDLVGNYKSTDKKYDNDPIGHGTHCAGIAAAVSNNKIGIASLSPDNRFVQVTSIKVLNSAGMGTQAKIIKGITQASDMGADVISLSLGGFSSKFRQKAYVEAVKYANKAGAIVVVAAGNSNANAKRYSPANTPGVITVTAADTVVNRAHFSNTIQDLKMGVCAPGVKVYSTIPGSKYAYFNGTSMATPYVSGLIGVMKSLYPKLTTKQAFEIIDKTGIKTNDTEKTGKFIQPAAAIEDLLD